MSSEQDPASRSLAGHLARGVLGFGLVGAAFALTPSLGAAALLLAPPGLVALGGCPTCWMLGLAERISAGRLQRTCTEEGCELGARPALRVRPTPQARPASRTRPAPQARPTPQARLASQARPASRVRPTPQARPASRARPTPHAPPTSTTNGALPYAGH